jgi:hypothetical protein
VSRGPVGNSTLRDRVPDADDFGIVVRPVGPISPATTSTSTLTAIPASVAPVVLLAANADRLGFSIRNTSTTDTLYIKASASGGAVSPTYHTVALRPSAYYEDPYHYVGEVTGMWDPGATGEALVDEYSP